MKTEKSVLLGSRLFFPRSQWDHKKRREKPFH